MAGKENIKEEPKEEKKKSVNVPEHVSAIFTGNFLTKGYVLNQLPFIFFMSLLAIVYIANGYYAEKTVIELNKVTNDIKELRSEFITLKSELNYRSKQSQVAKAVQPFGLKESVVPPVKIVVSKEELEALKRK